MELFRICRAEFAGKLTASGLAGRWNPPGTEVIYASEHRSLACLENIVHRSGLGHSEVFRVMVIYVPDDALQVAYQASALPKFWRAMDNLRPMQELGQRWLSEGQALTLKVPSVIIPEEYNVAINVRHSQMARVKVIDVLPFLFDPRMG